MHGQKNIKICRDIIKMYLNEMGWESVNTIRSA
jgi:hypothetical protein